MALDPSMIEASEAYRENGHCKMNNLICKDGDCRKCSFVVDGAMMMTLQTLCNELSMVRKALGFEDPPCNCEGDCTCQ